MKAFVQVAKQISNCLTTIIGGSCHKYNFCRDKTRPLSRQKYACRDKRFVATKLCLSRQKRRRIVTTKMIHVFVATKHVFCRDKTILSRQNYACRDKHVFVATNICHDKRFVATSILFLAIKDVFCRDKHVFVATKLLSRHK